MVKIAGESSLLAFVDIDVCLCQLVHQQGRRSKKKKKEEYLPRLLLYLAAKEPTLTYTVYGSSCSYYGL